MKRKILNTALIGIIVLKIFINICRYIEWSLVYYYNICTLKDACHNESCHEELTMIFDSIERDLIIDTIFIVVILIIGILIISGKSHIKHKSDK